ncbi:DUF6541 family protein [Pseudonocardia sp.]|uniref:DUF6541 family protein n=1 Tax=Pseudonocardia sp. TaxID=60912 RepID=UPI002608460E|nr:DUF6541 family protein [Pseudonocardia sp.]
MPDPGTATTPILIMLIVVAVPGLLFALAAGLRGWLLAATGPLCTFGLIGIGASVLPVLGVRWSPVTLALGTVVVAGLVAVARFTLGRLRSRPAGGPPAARAPWRRVDHAAVAAAVVVSTAVGFGVMSTGTAGFTAIPQFWDTAFHANAIRYISDTGASAPSALGALSGAEGEFYYPNAFHVVAATLVMITDVPVTVALELLTAFAPGLFALGTAALVRTVSGRPSIAVASALLTCAFSAFPYDLAGVLLPYVVALALLPAFLALWADVLAPDRPRRVTRAVCLAIATVGLIALHPSAVVAAAVLGAAYLVQQWWTRGPSTHDAVVIGVGAVATVLLGAPLVIASAGAAGGGSFDWPVAMSSAEAVGTLLTFAHSHEHPQWWLAGAVVLGLAGVRRHPELRWLAASALLFGAVFVMAAAYEGALVEVLSRPWWNDRFRLVALWVVALVPLAGSGLVVVRDVALDALRRLRVPDAVPAARGRLLPAALLAVLLFGVVEASDGLYFGRNSQRISEGFTDGPAVSYAEERAFTRLATIVPPGSLVMNDPYDGSPLMYALRGVRPVFPQPLHQQLDLAGLTPDRALLYTSFRDIDTDPVVREVVRRMNITHAIVSAGLVYSAPGNAPGMVGLDAVDSLRIVYSSPTTIVYEVQIDDQLAAG